MDTKKRLNALKRKMAKSRIMQLLLSNRKVYPKCIKPIVIQQCGSVDASLDRSKKKQEVLIIQRVKELDDDSNEDNTMNHLSNPPISNVEWKKLYRERNTRNELNYNVDKAKQISEIKEKCFSGLQKYHTIQRTTSPKQQYFPFPYPSNPPKYNRYSTNLVPKKDRQLKSLNNVKNCYKCLRSKQAYNTDTIENLLKERRSHSGYRSFIRKDYLHTNLKKILRIRLNSLSKTFDQDTTNSYDLLNSKP